ncbi:colicin D domain-containing protein [Amycolatopsis sp. WGS_07]|uniref:colicin D domain-containing protein n=1 Tax=Amycolatopsis sp. WGS_07 TaxID=3076764 RepID=UPI003872D5E5
MTRPRRGAFQTDRELQSHFKHARDFGIDQNWSNADAKAYEDALRKFAEDPTNSIKTADADRCRGEPAILIWGRITRPGRPSPVACPGTGTSAVAKPCGVRRPAWPSSHRCRTPMLVAVAHATLALP